MPHYIWDGTSKSKLYLYSKRMFYAVKRAMCTNVYLFMILFLQMWAYFHQNIVT